MTAVEQTRSKISTPTAAAMAATAPNSSTPFWIAASIVSVCGMKRVTMSCQRVADRRAEEPHAHHLADDPARRELASSRSARPG